ncbi:eukaryotic translation initiation factor 3 subunit H-like [Mizuhopecten yessoensis]|nr:eukaryotic translation initiation factor 3 subunit H-like [Mizuhopecten yessoensis]
MLEKNLRQLMESVDDVAMDANRYLNFQRQAAKQKLQKSQYIQKRASENAQRTQHGEAPLPEEDINRLFKPLQPMERLHSLLLAGQIDNYCAQVGDFASQSLGKLFLSESLKNKPADN